MQKIFTKCPMCGQKHIFEVTDKQYELYVTGQSFIQDIFPELSESEREMLITGICDKCWAKLFPKEDEE